jgi:hypothetical protein
VGILSSLGFGKKHHSEDPYFRAGIVVAELVNMQIALATNKPKANAASVGYIYGMFDYAAYMDKLELNDQRAHIVLKNLLSSTLPASREACWEILMAGQTSPDFSRAVSAGADDYKMWMSSQGKVTPTSLLRLSGF